MAGVQDQHRDVGRHPCAAEFGESLIHQRLHGSWIGRGNCWCSVASTDATVRSSCPVVDALPRRACTVGTEESGADESDADESDAEESGAEESDAEDPGAEDPGAENSGPANSWAVITRASFLAPRFLGPRIAGAGCSRIVVVRAPGVANGTCPCPSAPPLDRMAGGDGPGGMPSAGAVRYLDPVRSMPHPAGADWNRTGPRRRHRRRTATRAGPKNKRSTDGNRTG